MTFRGFQSTSFSEPSIVVNVQQTEVEEEIPVIGPVYPLRPSLPQRVSQFFLHNFNNPTERQRTSNHCQRETADCRCSLPPLYDDMDTSEPFSAVTSGGTTPPTSLSEVTSPTQGESRRPSVITQATDKLKHLLRYRKTSTGVENATPISPEGPQTIGLLVNPQEITEQQYAQASHGESAWHGAAHSLENPFSETSHEADTEPYQWRSLNRNSTRSPDPAQRKQSRRDSRWHFFSKSRQPSKERKALSPRGSQSSPRRCSSPELMIPQPPVNTPSSAVDASTSLARVIPRTSTDETTAAIHKDSCYIPFASFSSSKSSIASAKLSSALPSRPDSTSPVPTSPGQSDSHRPVSPPFGRPEVHPYSSTESLTASSTSLSSLGESISAAGSSQPFYQNRAHAIATSSLNIGAEGRSLPIDIPLSNHGNRCAWSQWETSSRHLAQVLRSEETFSTSAAEHVDRSGRAPASPALGPTSVLSPRAMQALCLGPRERPVLLQSDSSEALLFNMTPSYLARSANPPTPWPSALSNPAPPSQPATNHLGRHLAYKQKSEDLRSANRSPPPHPRASHANGEASNSESTRAERRSSFLTEGGQEKVWWEKKTSRRSRF